MARTWVNVALNVVWVLTIAGAWWYESSITLQALSAFFLFDISLVLSLLRIGRPTVPLTGDNGAVAVDGGVPGGCSLSGHGGIH